MPMRGGPLPIIGHRSGALFDPRIKASGEDEPAGTAAATCTTSFGHEIRLTACFASPPATSYVSIRRADGRPLDDPKVVAADGELLLIRVPVACAVPRSVDWFVYGTDPAACPSLRRLPCGRRLMRPAGIVSLGDEFVVAGLRLIRTFEGMDRAALAEGRRSVDVTGLKEVELAELFRYSSATDLCELKTVAVPYDGDALKPFQWCTDQVLAADGSTMYWVDLHRGLLRCDVAADDPELSFIRLPEIEVWKDILNHSRILPELNCTVGVCKGLVKFVDIDNGRFETRRRTDRFTVTTWVLNKIAVPAKWAKVSVLQVNDELWTLPNFRDSPLPKLAPLCPMVSAKDVRLFHFMLEEVQYYGCEDWMITVNMHQKRLMSYERRTRCSGPL